MQFSVWVKHYQYYAVSFLFFSSYSAHFFDFKLDSAQTESLGSELSLRPIFRPALCGHAYLGESQYFGIATSMKKMLP